MLDLAGGFGQNGLWLTLHSPEFRVVNCDISDEALGRGSDQSERVLAHAGSLPFAPASFDTILCVRFFDARVRFSELLAPGGTLFFESFTRADEKYRPDFNPAHRFDLTLLPTLFSELNIVLAHETDDGKRVYATVIAQKSA